MKDIRLFCESGPAEEKDGLVWKTAARTGVWHRSPLPGGDPLTIDRPLLEDVTRAFSEGAWEHVTVPLSHRDRVDENTGFVRALRVEDDPRRPGQAVLKAGIKFTEPDIRDKVLRGSIANCSVGISLKGHTRTEDGRHFPRVLKHLALTNQPWLNGLDPFGELAASMDGTKPVTWFRQGGDIPAEVLAAIGGTQPRQEARTDPEVTAALRVVVANPTEEGGADMGNEKGGEEVLTLSMEDLEALVDRKVKERTDTGALALSQTQRELHAMKVSAKVEALQRQGHSPAVLKLAEQFYLADEQQDAMLTLSREDGDDVPVSVTDVVDTLLAAIPATALHTSQPSVAALAMDPDRQQSVKDQADELMEDMRTGQVAQVGGGA